MEVFDFLLIIVASWYTQHILRWTAGPFNVFDFVRGLFGLELVETEEETALVVNKPNVIADLFMCAYCISLWTFLVLFVIHHYFPPAIYALAGAGFTSMLASTWDRI